MLTGAGWAGFKAWLLSCCMSACWCLWSYAWLNMLNCLVNLYPALKTLHIFINFNLFINKETTQIILKLFYQQDVFIYSDFLDKFASVAFSMISTTLAPTSTSSSWCPFINLNMINDVSCKFCKIWNLRCFLKCSLERSLQEFCSELSWTSWDLLKLVLSWKLKSLKLFR